VELSHRGFPVVLNSLCSILQELNKVSCLEKEEEEEIGKRGGAEVWTLKCNL